MITYPILKAQAECFDHGSMFFHAAQEEILDPVHSIQVCLRSFNPQSHGFHRLSVEFVHEMGVAATIEEIEKVVGDRPAYLSFDIDGLDLTFARGTGTLVRAGLSS